MPSKELCARNLSVGSLSDVAREWGLQVQGSHERLKPDQLYCGRAYSEARLASNALGAELAVVSAGHGIVRSDQEIPAYGLTVAPGKPDSVQDKVEESQWSSAKWWRALGDCSPASVGLSDYFLRTSADLILISLSENYANLLFDELSDLDDSIVDKIRIFGAGLHPHLPTNVKSSLMPYDVRLNGPDSPIRGTMSDFPTRALHHFAQGLKQGWIGGQTSSKDRCDIENLLRKWAPAEIPVRKKMTDGEVVNFILQNWERTKGRSGASLRLLRDSGNACEQSRFKDLFKLANAEREKSEVGAA